MLKVLCSQKAASKAHWAQQGRDEKTTESPARFRSRSFIQGKVPAAPSSSVCKQGAAEKFPPKPEEAFLKARQTDRYGTTAAVRQTSITRPGIVCHSGFLIKQPAILGI